MINSRHRCCHCCCQCHCPNNQAATTMVWSQKFGLDFVDKDDNIDMSLPPLPPLLLPLEVLTELPMRPRNTPVGLPQSLKP